MPYKLVLAGKPMWENSTINAKLSSMTYASDVIYRACFRRSNATPALIIEALVMPSFSKALDSVVEAMYCETPVICSNVTSLLEVAGDAALFIDPNKLIQ